jgi:hypothetical protein
MKLLEHSFINFTMKDAPRGCGLLFSAEGVHLRDWKRILALMVNGDYNNYFYWGSLRDLIEISPLFDVFDIAKKYGVGELCERGPVKVSNGVPFEEPVYQIKIKTNRFTAMQLRTHQNISWLTESTRSVNYKEKGFNLCSAKEIPWYRKSICCLTYSIYKFLMSLGAKKEDAGRVLDEYRETHIIGFAHREDWLELARKRIHTGAQGDCEFIAKKILEQLDED